MSSKRVEGRNPVFGSRERRLLSRLAAYLKVTAAIAAILSNSAAWAQQLPTGGTVAAGSATIGTPQNGTLNINQSSNQAIINWNAFSVGSGGTVNFNQPGSSSATLNRVTGSTPSWIGGTINAPGTVLLVNPNGIAITKSGVINTGSFAASTLDISNADFMAGNYKFTGNGGSAAVRNSGRINVSDGGFAALLGGQVANNGVISARLGKVGLGAGELITLDLAGDGFLSVAVPSSQLGKLVDSSGALVSNKGKIRADGGSVFLTAATASSILRDAVNVPGSIRANTVGTHNGRIVIGGGDGRVSVTGKIAANGGTKRNGGKIEVSGAKVDIAGKVTANGKNGGTITATAADELLVRGTVSAAGKDGAGGRIDLTAANVGVVGALIDASGTSAGGLVRIGGTFQGGNGDPNDPFYNSYVGRFGALPNIASAQAVIVDESTTINVSATAAGDAGSAIIWSEQFTNYAGTLLGTGGLNGGNGGFAEISSHGVLGVYGTAHLTAAVGENGRLLLDPFNVTISSGTNNVTPTGTPLTYTPTATATINATALVGLLNAGNDVVVTTGTGGTANVGFVNVSAGLTWTTTNSLTLTATTTMSIGSAITATNGTLILNGGTLSTPTMTISAAINVASLTINANAAVTANSGAITTPNLRLIGTNASYSLTNASNNIGTVAANISGTSLISLTNSQNLSIGSVGGTNGITATTVNLSASSGRTVSQTQAIAATSLSLAGAGATYNLNSASNSVATLAAGTTTNRLAALTFVNSKGLTLNTIGSVNAIAASGAISITANGATADITVSRSVSTTYSGAADAITMTAGRDILINNTITANSATSNAIVLTAARNISISNSISATAGILTLRAGSDTNPNATITENTGSWGLNVNSLLLATAATSIANGPDVQLGSSVFFGGGGNSNSSTMVGTVAGRVRSLLLGVFDGTVTVGTVSGVSGITTAADLTLGSFNGNGFITSAPIVSGGNFTTFASFTLGSSVNVTGTWDVVSGTITANNSAANVSLGALFMSGGTVWTQVAASLPSFSANDFTLFGTAYGGAAAKFLRAAGGDGSSGNPYVITDVYGLQGISGYLDQSFKVGQDFSASVTSGWNSGAGLTPIGYDASTQQGTAFTGALDGNNKTITGLKISLPTTFGVGLFGNNAGTIKNLTLAGVDVYGQGSVGGLAGQNSGTITNVSVAGTVTGDWYDVGGLAGWNNNGGVISGSSSSATITMSNGSFLQYAGGLTGENYGSIINSSATGSVSGYTILGGLVGANYGTISGSSAGGDVNGPYVAGTSSFLGGLVGINSGSISSSHATGNVNGNIPGADYNGGNWSFGGLVGMNISTISDSYATGNVKGMNDVGGLVGTNAGTLPGGSGLTAGTITNSYASGTVTGNASVGGLVGTNGGSGFVSGQYVTIGGTVTDSHATGQVNGADIPTSFGYTITNSNLGGLVGNNPGEIARSYANVIVSGDSYLGGLVGYNQGSIHEAYALGNVTGVGERIGGLIGQNSGTVVNAYAKGNASGNLAVGGLVGLNDSGTLTSVYSTGTANAAFIFGGALVGEFDSGTITNAYWDSTTAGSSGFGSVGSGVDISGALGLSTADLKHALPSGFSTSFWGIIPDTTYPYLLIQPGIVSGTVYNTYGGSVVAGVTVYELVNGTGSTSIVTDANGKYSFFLNELANGGELLVFTGNGASYRQNVTSAVVLDIYGGYLTQSTSGGSASSLTTGLTTALGGNTAVIAGLTGRAYNLTGGSFVFDEVLNLNSLVISATGAVTQSANITAANLLLTGPGSYTFTNTGNQLGTVAANTGSLSLTSATPLVVDTVLGVSGITSTGNVTLTADSVTLTGLVTAGGDVTLAPLTAGTAIFVGTSGTGFVVTAADIAKVTANTLVIGNAAAGALTVNQSIAPNSSNLALVSGSTVTQTTGVITVGGLGLQGTSFAMNGTTTATSFASASTSAPTINFTGDLTIATIGPIAGISWTDSSTATIKATGNITVSGVITNTGGGSLVLYADSAASGTGAITFVGNGFINFANNPNGKVSLYEHPAGYPFHSDFSSKVTVNTNNGGSYYQYNLVDSANDLQAINQNLTPYTFGIGYGYALNKDLDLSNFGNFTPLSDGSSTWFSAIFDGQYHTISNLTVAIPVNAGAGLFGNNSGIVRNLALINVNISGPFASSSGGVAGYNTGLIDQVYVTGTVSGSSAGGVVGDMYSGGIIRNAFTNVKVVTDNNQGGGIVGQLESASGYASMVSNSVAVGFVTATSGGSTGGLIGRVFDNGGTSSVVASYWDQTTTGQTGDALASTSFGKTTPTLQNALFGLDTSVWATGPGLYPYLKNFYPAGAPQAVSGFAYTDRGITPVGGGTAVGLVVNGAAFDTPYTGSNGYFYSLLPSLGSGSEVVAYTTGATAGVSYRPGVTGSLSNFHVYGTFLTAYTTATALSAVPAMVGNAAAQTAASGLSNIEYDLLNTTFNIDQAMSLTSKVLVLNTAGTVTQSAGISVTGSGSGLLLLGSGATYNLTGSANNVSILAASVATGTINLNNGSNNLSIGTVLGTAGVTTSGAGSFTVSSSGNVTQTTGANISGAAVLLGGGNYTLNNTNAITTLAGSVGTLSVTNGSTLTIGAIGSNVGLTALGAVTLASNAITISSALNAAGQTVTLVPRTAGSTISLGTGGTLAITQASLSNITAATLVIGGANSSGNITVATNIAMPTTVTNLALITTGNSGAVTIAAGVTLSNPNASGSITVQANTLTFGNTASKITANSTSGTVTILPWTTTRAMNIAGSATGALSLAAAVFTNSQVAASNVTFGGTGLAGTLTVSANTTLTTSITNLTLINSTVTIAAGTTLTNNNTNGSIKVQADTITFTNASSSRLVADAATGTIAIYPFTAGRGMTIGGSGGTTLNLATTALSGSEISAANFVFGSASGGNITVSAATSVAAVTNLMLISGGSVTLSASLTDNAANGSITLQGATLVLNAALTTSGTTGTVTLNAPGSATQSAAITAAKLLLLNGSFNLTTATNSVGMLAANAGSVNFAQNGSLSIGAVSTTNGVTATGTATIATGGDLTIALGSKVNAANDIVLSATGAFVNNQGSDAAGSTGGRWLIYSANPVGDTFNGLDSTNTAIWNATISSLPPGSVSATGNRYIFAFQPTATFTSTDVAKTYGDTGVLTGAFTVSVPNGVSDAFLADASSSVYTGAPSLLSTGTAAGVGVGSYAIAISNGSLISTKGYQFAFVGSGQVVVSPRAVTVTADIQSRAYGDANPANGTATGNNLANGDSIASVTLTSPATAASDVGSYDLTGSAAVFGSGLASNYLITYATRSGGLSITQRALTVTADGQSRIYGDANPANGTATGNSLVNGDSIASVTLTSPATAASNVGSYDLTGSTAVFGNGLASNYLITYATRSGGLSITQRAVTVTADAQSKTYGDVNPVLTYTTSSLGQGAALSGSLSTAAPSSDVGIYAINKGGVNNANNPNYLLTYLGANLTISRALLTIIADDKTRVINAPNPQLTATFRGLVNGDGSSAVAGLTLSTLADVNSPAGRYNIDPSGAAARNYTISYVPGTMFVTSTDTTTVPSSQVNPTTPSLPANLLTIPSFNPPAGVTQVSFTPPPAPPVRVGNTPSNEIAPASLPSGQNFATNKGLTYPPVSQFDPNQYSQFKTPDWAGQAGLAAIYVMLARGIDQEHAADVFIDGLWNGTSAAWTPPQPFTGKVTFSDGAGNTVNPTGNAGSPIVAGTTDLGQLLKNGPVMISDGATPAHWLLVTQLTPDGKGIVANDPASGKQVVLNYDAATKTVGGVTSVFDANSNKFVPFAEASAGTPSLASLQSFVPAAFLAVSTK